LRKSNLYLNFNGITAVATMGASDENQTLPRL